MFQSHRPVANERFFDREGPLARLEEVLTRLQAGAPTWLAIIGQRKVGKTSLLWEMRRRHEHSDIAFVFMDLFEPAVVDVELFRLFAWRVADAFIASATGESLENLAGSDAYLDVVATAPIPPASRSLLLRLPGLTLDDTALRACLELPEQLAAHTGRPLLVAWDEFQELTSARGLGMPFLSTMRSIWQRHERTSYIISGSEPSMLRELVSSEASPFFQHFDVMELRDLPEPEALKMLEACSEGRISEPLGRRLIDVVGTQPFYLQVLGEELVRDGAPFDEQAIRHTAQRVLFSRTGRLSLYFERRFAQLIGRSTYLAATVEALAVADATVTELARTIGAPSGDTVRYISRLGDAVERQQDRWRLTDPTFARWVAWRSPGGRAVPMKVLGDEGERRASSRLATLGFDLVYQSRASRGAFDLLATRGVHQLGVQVKRTKLPLVFDLDTWARMQAEAERFGWRWVLAQVDDDAVRFLDPAAARVGRTARVHEDATITNLLQWLAR